MVVGIIAAVVLLLRGWLVTGYNGLVRARNAYQNAFSQIDVQLQRRFDRPVSCAATSWMLAIRSVALGSAEEPSPRLLLRR
jgi:hypothetical protein